MKKTFKKIAASVMAAATLAVGTVSMTASAYSPTITRSFSFDNATITGSLYRDPSVAYGTTSSTKKFYKLTVSIRGGGGDNAYGSSNNVDFIEARKSSPNGEVSSTHYAYKNSSSYGSTSITC